MSNLYEQRIEVLEKKLRVANRILRIILDTDRKVKDSPLYSFNPSFQTIKCAYLLIEDDNNYVEITKTLNNVFGE